MDTSERDNLTRLFVDFGSMPQENVTFQPLFDQALAAQQLKNWDESLKLYTEILDKGQSDLSSQQAATVYHNLSAIYYQKNDTLMSFTYAKKSLALDPNNKIFKATYEAALKKFDVPRIPSQISVEQKTEKVVSIFSFDIWALLSLIVFFVFCRQIFEFLLIRKKNIVESLNVKTYIWKPLASVLVLFIMLISTTISYKTMQKTEAILLGTKNAIQTAPGENKTVIFEAPQGLLVEVIKAEGSYLQIKYPGAFSGWLEAKNLEVFKWPTKRPE